MINHCVQFDRPLANADLVSGQNEGAPTSDQDPNAPSDAPGATPNDFASSAAIEKQLADISRGIENLHARHDDIVGELQAFSVRLALRVVEKIVGSVESIQTQRLEHLLAEAIGRNEPAVCIYLNSQDIPKIEAWLENNSHREMNVLADDAVEAGECRVDFAAYEITSSLAQQVDEMEHRLLEVMGDD